ncbi:MAG: UbiA prenyltransferase family protein [Desulfobacula sp.]|jgi:decaprenyl-phosphate phosphoribosyltransferase|uniref:UbiA prenyltransferase family protein n=1 Tax=Desulfobacula sp. TaxID=2593537 RepID=UPI001D4D8869|nr:UbiA prenyltransferase family protein [Desulfobacula sp.]MBT3485886.1 UbiA prenyltransferase family protein [Desulfobacula sp.]MBT3805489.1 UbiA prenyltransferase family protein [Desulfobacula sp.]MBT4026796.1 UbiA prenyltransferase family protein [Desulfobacula sp.]MBT4199600.1 UbiA prenyltransferase family protein [Desulfobacula sp.]
MAENKINIILFCKTHIKLIRPNQWIKNLLLFSPLFFSGNLLSETIFITGLGCFVFCLVSGLGYIVNDWVDKVNDQFHPEKQNRPFCARTVSGKTALVLSAGLVFLIILISVFSHFPSLFLTYLLAYLLLSLSYSLYFKSIVIFEIFVIATGFVLRVLAGGAVCNVAVSSWLFLTVFFIAMMISIAKRLNELKELGKKTARLHRQSQAGYSLTFLNNMLWACGSVTLVVYSLYAVEHGKFVIFSIIPAAYGIFRFIYLADFGKAADPIKTLFSDSQLLLSASIFLLFLTIIIYST